MIFGSKITGATYDRLRNLTAIVWGGVHKLYKGKTRI